MGISPKQPKDQLISAVLTCPYVAAGMEEKIEVGFTIQWSDPPVEDEKDAFIVRLTYRDLGRRRHSVDIHLVVPRKANYSFGGAKQLAPKLFMTARNTTIIEQSFWRSLWRRLNRRRIWRRMSTADKPKRQESKA